MVVQSHHLPDRHRLIFTLFLLRPTLNTTRFPLTLFLSLFRYLSISLSLCFCHCLFLFLSNSLSLSLSLSLFLFPFHAKQKHYYGRVWLNRLRLERPACLLFFLIRPLTHFLPSWHHLQISSLSSSSAYSPCFLSSWSTSFSAAPVIIQAALKSTIITATNWVKEQTFLNRYLTKI